MSIELTEAEKIKIINADDLYGIMQKILLREDKIDQDREHFWVVGLATNNRILFIELVSKGSINRVTVEPMEVFSLALQKRAVSIILVHNHPSGDLKPSWEDKDITDRLIQVGIIVNTFVTDHLIITTKSFLSFAYSGLLDELAKSTKYVPKFKQIENLRKEAEKNKAIEMAKNCLKKNMDIELIMQLTGLTYDEIKALG
ncbi:MAG: JAB domain-containing protein [Crocinitomix sp.]|nr:JAB domain-containing protein [Crocinitomix sp.]